MPKSGTLTNRQVRDVIHLVMSALPPEQMRTMRDAVSDARQPVGSLTRRWEDLHHSAAQLARAAALSPEDFDGDLAAFPAMLGEANEWQREMAWQGIEDIDAMMRPGLAALNTLTERGNDATVPALALWREFHHAREAVLALVHNETV